MVVLLFSIFVVIIYLFIYLFIYSFIYLFIYLFIYSFIYLFILMICELHFREFNRLGTNISCFYAFSCVASLRTNFLKISLPHTLAKAPTVEELKRVGF